MIILQTDKFQIDLSAYGVSLNEESDLFNDNINRNYSLPFPIKYDADLLSKLGLANLDNITNVETKIKCQLVLPDRFYPATLFLGRIKGQHIECNLTYGNDNLKEYDIPLKDLPWPTIIIAGDLTVLANLKKMQDWPRAGYQFPMLYKPEIREKSNYERFEGFVNNHNGEGYLKNEIDSSGIEPAYINRNVMAPFPYLLEILTFGFGLAGKKVFGDVLEDPVKQKVLYAPKNFMEKFRGSDFEEFSFDKPTTTEISYAYFSVYSKTFVPTQVGTYEISFGINLDPVLARIFEFNIFRVDALSGKETNIYKSISRDNRVRIEDKLSINVAVGDQYDPVRVELKIPYTSESIQAYNSFEWNFTGGKLNQFPSSFSLAAFMPDMTFGEFVNALKNWWNFEVDIQDRYVEINYVQESVLKRRKEKHSHLEIPEPYKQHNSNRFYKLSYANGEKIFYTKNGQLFSEIDEKGDEVIEIKMEVQPLVVEQNENIITAVSPEENSELDFVLYDGPAKSGRPTCSSALRRAMQLQSIFDDHWVQWIRFRIFSKTFKETFECSVHQRINIDELSVKYNELHVIKKLNRKYLSENLMKVDLESETF